jgi:hypothetical protein
VQSSVQSLFEILSFVAGSILSRPQDFHWLMLGSLCSVSGAGALYAAHCLGLGPGGGGARGGGGGGALFGRQRYARLAEEGGGGGGPGVGGGVVGAGPAAGAGEHVRASPFAAGPAPRDLTGEV